MTYCHPRKNNHGQPVEIIAPSQPSNLSSWGNPDELASVEPDGAMPEVVGDVAISSWRDAPDDNEGWEALAAATIFDEPPFKPKSGKNPASGVVVVETDGRLWVVSPSNRYGGYINTFPKGTIHSGDSISLRANALKEAYEEAGLRVELIEYLADSERTTTTTRYYLARRIGGNPADMGWESQACHLVPRIHLAKFVTHNNDLLLIQVLKEKVPRPLTQHDIVAGYSLTSAERIIFTVDGFRQSYGQWPQRIKLWKEMADGIQERILTPLGWSMLANKLEIVRISEGTVIAEGSGHCFEYDAGHVVPPDGERADVWIWGIKLVG